MKRFQNIYKQLLLMLIVPLGVLGIFIQYKILPAQYFADSTLITQNINAGIGFTDAEGGYGFASGVLGAVNIFGFQNTFQWSVFLAIVIYAMFIPLILKLREINGLDFLFSAGALLMPGCFVINPSPDVLQLILFMIVCAALKTNRLIVIIPASIVFAVCTVMLHPYYLPNYSGLYSSCGIECYELEINDWIFNQNIILNNILNYLINVCRILFPAEILKNADAFSFALFAMQILFSYRLIKITAMTVKKGGRENVFRAAAVLIYFFAAAAAENDFLAVLRHEVCAVPLMLPITFGD